MRDVWQRKAIADLVEPLTTVDPRKAPNEEFRYIDVSSVSRDVYRVTGAAVLKGKDAPSRARRLVKAGDVLFATIRPTLQRIAIVPEEFDGEICSTGFFVLRPKPGILSRFLFYSLFTEEFYGRMESLQRGASYPAVSDSDVKDQYLLVPPLSEQKRIVAILDEAFAGIETAIANTEKNLANAWELFEAYLVNLFNQSTIDWQEQSLSSLCEGKITDGTHQTPKYFDAGYIFLSSKNVTERKIDWDNVKYVDQKQHDQFQKRLSPKKNDILLAKNGTTGVAAIVDRDVIFDIYVSLALLRPSNMILPRYLLHFINSPLAKEQFNKRLKGVGVPNLHLKEIREVNVKYPSSLKDQEKITRKIDDMLVESQRLEYIYQKKLESLTELKQSLLHKAFSGELTANKAEDEMQEAVA